MIGYLYSPAELVSGDGSANLTLGLETTIVHRFHDDEYNAEVGSHWSRGSVRSGISWAIQMSHLVPCIRA